METKTCCDCDQQLPLDNFSFKDKARGKLQSRCKSCYNAYNRQYYAGGEKTKQKARTIANAKSMRARYQDWKSTQSCKVCGEGAAECLDLHHINPAEKDDALQRIVSFGSWRRVEEEIAKCIVVCANCHRKIHSGRIECPVSSAG